MEFEDNPMSNFDGEAPAPVKSTVVVRDQVATLLCSSPQKGTDGTEIMHIVEAVCNARGGDLKFAYDWANSSTADPRDSQVNWSDPGSVRGSYWFGKYRSRIKEAIMMSPQDANIGTIVLLSIEGGPVSSLEAGELTSIKREVMGDLKAKDLSISIEVNDVGYDSFMKKYAPAGFVVPQAST